MHSELGCKLGTEASHIHNPHFEDAIVKIQNGMEDNLTAAEEPQTKD